MKLKNILTGFLLMAGLGVSQAQQYNTETFTLAVNTALTNLIHYPVKVAAVSITVPTGNSATYLYAVLDAPWTNAIDGARVVNPRFWTNAAYTNIVSYRTNISVSTNTYEGVTTNYYRSNVLWTARTISGAATNNYTTVLAGSASTVTTITLDYSASPLFFGFGFTFTNTAVNTNITVQITYDLAL